MLAIERSIAAISERCKEASFLNTIRSCVRISKCSRRRVTPGQPEYLIDSRQYDDTEEGEVEEWNAYQPGLRPEEDGDDGSEEVAYTAKYGEKEDCWIVDGDGNMFCDQD